MNAAFKVADMVGIDRHNVMFRAKPEGKKYKVEDLQNHGEKVMFVGDGVNDSPVLAQSDIGVAINSQSHITVDAAGIVLMKESLYDVFDSLRIS